MSYFIYNITCEASSNFFSKEKKYLYFCAKNINANLIIYGAKNPFLRIFNELGNNYFNHVFKYPS